MLIRGKFKYVKLLCSLSPFFFHFLSFRFISIVLSFVALILGLNFLVISLIFLKRSLVLVCFLTCSLCTQAVIVPIYKEEDKLDCNNYFGVSLYCHYSKILTSTLMERIKIRTEEILSEEFTSRFSNITKHHHSASYPINILMPAEIHLFAKRRLQEGI